MELIQKFVEALSDWLGVIGALFAGLAWWKARLIRRQQEADERRCGEPIRLILVREADRKEHVLGYQPRRDQASRGELVGILGMYSGVQRFEASRLVPLLESGNFDRMVDGTHNELRFELSAEDFNRFVGQDKLLDTTTNPAQPL